MKAVLTAVIAAIEAVAVAVAGFALVAVMTVLLWWLAFDLGADPLGVVSIAAALWQLAHLIPMTVDVPAVTALSFGLPAEAFQFTLSLPLLGLTLVTALLGARSGWRLAERSHPASPVVGGALGFAAAAGAVTVLTDIAAWPVWLMVLVPTLVYALPLTVGVVARAAREGHDWWSRAVRGVQRLLEPLHGQAAAALPERAAEALRLALAVLALLIGLGAMGVAVTVFTQYVDIIALSQSLQLDVFGAIMVCIVQLVMLPVAWVWAIAWFAGPGFAVGVGSAISPFDTLVWPLPSLPILGALPNDWAWAGALAPVLVVLIGVIVGAVAAGQPLLRRATVTVTLTIPLVAAVVVGLLVALLGWLASGSIGPGRLEFAGVNPWLVGGCVAVEVAVGLLLGIGARQVDVARLKTVLPSLSPTPLTREHPSDLGSSSSAAQDTALAVLGEPAEVRETDAFGSVSGDDSETQPVEPLRSTTTPAPEPETEPETELETEPEPEPEVASLDPLLDAFSWENQQKQSARDDPSGDDRSVTRPRHTPWWRTPRDGQE